MNVHSLGDGPSLLSDAQNPLREFVRAYGLVERVMHPYFQKFGVTPSQWGMLRTLWRAEKAGEPGLRLTDLSDRLLVRPPSVTATVARLRRASLVRRERIAGDGRAWLIQLTLKGRRLVQRVLRGHERQLRLLLDGLSTSQQEGMMQIMRQWSEHLERMMAATTPGNPSPHVRNGHGQKTVHTSRKLTRRS
ncbi:MAG: MarR family transcriptional regulator [Planctomycetes bacterium]|nr:MarR family transcriptional regulator [Planctomycetota bacterium]